MDEQEAVRVLVERLHKVDDADVLEALGVLSSKQRLRNNIRRVINEAVQSGMDMNNFDGHKELLAECAEYVIAYSKVLEARGFALESVEITGAMAVERNVHYLTPGGEFNVRLRP